MKTPLLLTGEYDILARNMHNKSISNYSPAGMIIGDVCFLQEKDDYHVFYLQQPATLINPEDRHDLWTSIGHAVSKDLYHWKGLPPIIKPSNGLDKWDNLVIWTGSIIKKENTYYLFYTGKSDNPEEKLTQRIGVATSTDLVTWNKSDQNPLLESDNKIYADSNKLDQFGRIGAWRDPFVFKNPKSNDYFMLISARLKGEETIYNGCIAIAQSKDLINWNLQKPVLAPGIYEEMEVPQMVCHKDKYYIFFSAHASGYNPEFTKKIGGAFGGLHCYYSDDILGEYRPINGNGVVYSNKEDKYGLTVVKNIDDTFSLLGYQYLDNEDNFIGKLSHPMKIEIDNDKTIVYSNGEVITPSSYSI